MRTLYNLPVVLFFGIVFYGICMPLYHLIAGRKFSKEYMRKTMAKVEYFESRFLFKYLIYDVLNTILYITTLTYYIQTIKPL